MRIRCNLKRTVCAGVETTGGESVELINRSVKSHSDNQKTVCQVELQVQKCAEMMLQLQICSTEN